mgnify:CR=1 FL=1
MSVVCLSGETVGDSPEGIRIARQDGVYGYCEDTGEPIGIERLEVRPVATLSIEAQERHERMEKTYDDEA